MMNFDKIRKLLNEKETVEQELVKLANDIKYTEENLVTMKESEKNFKKRNSDMEKELKTLMKES